MRRAPVSPSSRSRAGGLGGLAEVLSADVQRSDLARRLLERAQALDPESEWIREALAELRETGRNRDVR